ncbi:hypothetical protein GCM10009832_20890 [Dietzia kunjamensis subsp. schimae]
MNTTASPRRAFDQIPVARRPVRSVVLTFTDAPSDVRFPPDAAAAEKMSPPVCLVTWPHSISKLLGPQ